MLGQEYVGSVCEVKTLKNVFILSGRIMKLPFGEIEITDPAGPLPLITYKTPVKIAVFNANLGFRMMAGQVYASTRKALRVVDVLDFVDYEQRRFFRVDIDASAELIIKSKNESEKDESNDEPKEEMAFPIRVKNLSLCGMMFETDLALKPDMRLEVRMALHKNMIDTIDITIHRVRENDGMFVYGVEFEQVGRRAEQNLCAYLFDQQRKQIQRSKSAE